VRVIVNGKHPKYRRLNKRRLTRAVSDWRRQPHVVIGMRGGFDTRFRSGRPESDEFTATR
jgi:hypothetical protein